MSRIYHLLVFVLSLRDSLDSVVILSPQLTHLECKEGGKSPVNNKTKQHKKEHKGNIIKYYIIL